MTLTTHTEGRARQYRRLRIANIAVGAVPRAEAAAMLALSNGLSLPVFASYLRADPVTVQGPTPAEELFTIPIGPAVAVFLFLAAVDHLVVAAPACTGGTSATSTHARQLRPLDRVLDQRVDHDRVDRDVRRDP